MISVKDRSLFGIGGMKWMSWTLGTDVLPDYDGSRKKQPPRAVASEQQVPSLRLREAPQDEATKMPHDCADAVVALDKAASNGEAADDHGALANCQDAAMYGRRALSVARRRRAVHVGDRRVPGHGWSGPGRLSSPAAPPTGSAPAPAAK